MAAGIESRPGPQGTPPGSAAPESGSPDQTTKVIPAPAPAAAVPPPTRIPPATPETGGPGGSEPRRSRRGLWIALAAAVVVIIAVAAVVLGTSGHGPGSLVAGPTTSPAPPPAMISVPASAGAPINPSAPIAVSVTGGHLASVNATFTASDGSTKPVAGTIAPDQLSWANTDSLAFGTAYTVVVDAVNKEGTHNQKTFTVHTMAAGRTAYANVVPAPDVVANTGIGVGQPMVFQFTKPVSNKAEVQKHLHVTVTPAQPGAWYWVDDKDVHYRGPSYWQPGTKIHIEADVVGVDLGNGVLGAENNSADYTVHDSMVAKADGSTDQLTIFQNGKQINQLPMSLGSPGFPSHEGPHVISDKQPSIVMDSCTYGTCQGQPGYYKETVALDERISNDGEFVHSAPWSVGQQGSSNVSHGCVNLSPANAQWFFDHFGIGDVVEITNSGGPALPVWDTYGDWEVPWSTWQAGNANS
ncbi:L,D-transpeptidase family protein [Nocardia sp. NEAU-G5]|uniref:L,D-transpeptidase family protein n=1 Tax=Nocardia albiluteola TaxID=2842303 RepID=A0ABS6AYR0_9NOCA|nr:L,D-transpeptidase family protein [Nocardia albiluteola]